ncbi:MAG: RES family NAD+ phosphorylase [Alphaproteobacteria bacterium]|nr:RES family NAD+ phosphorylase [Alphaproteobacteria bacterium]
MNLYPACPYNSTSEDLRVTKAKLPVSNRAQDVVISRQIGDHWLNQSHTTLLRVPSVITPETFNILLNPKHADARNIKITKIYNALFDKRLKDCSCSPAKSCLLTAIPARLE